MGVTSVIGSCLWRQFGSKHGPSYRIHMSNLKVVRVDSRDKMIVDSDIM